MNSRRSFFKQLAVSAAAFSILPAAETYSRIWKPKAIVPVRYEINPDWVNAEYELCIGQWWASGEQWKCFIKRDTGLSAPPLTISDLPERFTMVEGTYEQIPTFIPV